MWKKYYVGSCISRNSTLGSNLSEVDRFDKARHGSDGKVGFFNPIRSVGYFSFDRILSSTKRPQSERNREGYIATKYVSAVKPKMAIAPIWICAKKGCEINGEYWSSQ